MLRNPHHWLSAMIGPELADRIKQLAETNNTGVDVEVRYAIEQHLKAKGPPREQERS